MLGSEDHCWPTEKASGTRKLEPWDPNADVTLMKEEVGREWD